MAYKIWVYEMVARAIRSHGLFLNTHYEEHQAHEDSSSQQSARRP